MNSIRELDLQPMLIEVLMQWCCLMGQPVEVDYKVLRDMHAKCLFL